MALIFRSWTCLKSFALLAFSQLFNLSQVQKWFWVCLWVVTRVIKQISLRWHDSKASQLFMLNFDLCCMLLNMPRKRSFSIPSLKEYRFRLEHSYGAHSIFFHLMRSVIMNKWWNILLKYSEQHSKHCVDNQFVNFLLKTICAEFKICCSFWKSSELFIPCHAMPSNAAIQLQWLPHTTYLALSWCS